MRTVKNAARLTALSAATLFLLAVRPPAVTAGWVVEEVDPDFPDDVTTLYFSGADVRVTGLVEGLVFLVDLDKGEGYIIDARERLFAGGAVEEIAASLQGGAPGAAEEEEGGRPAPMATLSAEPFGGGEAVAGFEAEGYRLLLGDLFVEEIWISPAIGPLTEGRGGSLVTILDIMTGAGTADLGEFPRDYEEEEAFRQLLRKGYPLRRVRRYRDEKTVTEVRRAERRDLSPSLFAIPSDYREAGYRRVFFGRE